MTSMVSKVAGMRKLQSAYDHFILKVTFKTVSFSNNQLSSFEII